MGRALRHSLLFHSDCCHSKKDKVYLGLPTKNILSYYTFPLHNQANLPQHSLPTHIFSSLVLRIQVTQLSARLSAVKVETDSVIYLKQSWSHSFTYLSYEMCVPVQPGQDCLW